MRNVRRAVRVQTVTGRGSAGEQHVDALASPWSREHFAEAGAPLAVLLIRPAAMPKDPVRRIAELCDALELDVGRVGIGSDVVVVLRGASVGAGFDLLDGWHRHEPRRRRSPGAVSSWGAEETIDDVVARCTAALAGIGGGQGILARAATPGS